MINSQIDLYDYDVDRLNRHKAILVRLCRELADKLEEATARAIWAEQALKEKKDEQA